MTKKTKTNNKKPSQSNGNNRRPTSGVRSTMVVPRAFVGSMGSTPRTRASGSALIVSHTEALEPVVQTTTLTKRIALVPSALPWLRGVAGSYSKFRWRRLRVFYLTQVSTNNDGRVALGFNYDDEDALPESVSALTSLHRASFGPVWSGTQGFDSANPFRPSDLVHCDLDASRASKPWYPYATATQLTEAESANPYSPAYLNVGIDGATANKTVGTLYVTYEIELIEPTVAQ